MITMERELKDPEVLPEDTIRMPRRYKTLDNMIIVRGRDSRGSSSRFIPFTDSTYHAINIYTWTVINMSEVSSEVHDMLYTIAIRMDKEDKRYEKGR